MDKLHGHVQIEYGTSTEHPDAMDTESLVGFNPTSEEDRKLCHDMLDEFLNRYLIPQFKARTNGSARAQFCVYGTLDNH